MTSLLAIASPQLVWSELHSLGLADRHAMIRAVWLLDGGGPARAEAHCEACGEGSEFEMDLSMIELPPRVEGVEVQLGAWTRNCRLPSAEMLEKAADSTDVAALCLGSSREEAAPWVDVVEEALAAHDPLGEIVLVGPCAGCGQMLQAEFDLKLSWVGWLRSRVRRLMADVHTLARNYHWSEDEILSIPESRRAVYLDFCDVEEPVEA
ncbi:MAG: hypothetical protein J0H49_07965 [Acidobacteria bacterium]|nr:hypothetical protein [Acidobacteriota bacterium]